MHYELVIPSEEKTVEAALAGVGLDGYGDGVASALVQFGQGTELKRAYWCFWPAPGVARPPFNPQPSHWSNAIAFDQWPAGRYSIHLVASDWPLPHELARPRPLAGTRVRLRDGNDWLVPAAPRLPREMVIGQTGGFQARLAPEYAWHLAAADRWRELATQPDTTHDVREAAQTVYRFLCLNYRLTPEVVEALGLFDSRNVEESLIAIIGGTDE